ncbi:MAG: hypothetical protein P4L87_22695 [Formivibrio sp.]|nr:hypothetical protein [Formivibrio sp.]
MLYFREFVNFVSDSGISIMVQGLSSQTVAFPVYSELQHNVRNLRSFKSVTAWAFTFTFIAYGTVGFVTHHRCATIV